MNNLSIVDLSSKQIADSIKRLNSVSKPDYKKGSSIELYIKQCDSIILSCFNLQNLIFLHTPYKPIYKVYRARPYSEIKNFESISEYSYPPKKKATLQRANLPYHPVFYCSLHPYTSLNEYIKNNPIEQDKFCVAVRSFKEITPALKVLPIFIENQTNFILKEQVELLFVDKSDDFKVAITSYINYLGDTFLKKIDKVHDYSFSAYLANKFLYGKYSNGDTVDILLYPSILSTTETNFAINPNIVDKYLNLDYVYVVEFLNKKVISTNFDLLLFKENIFDKKIENISLQDDDNKYTKTFLADFKLEIDK